MRLRTPDEQRAYLDGFERCAECIKQYLSDEGKKMLECHLMAVRTVVETEDIRPQENDDPMKSFLGYMKNLYLQNKDEVDKVAKEMMLDNEEEQ